MRSWYSLPIALVALAAAVYSGHRSAERRCAWTVERLPASAGGNVREALRARSPQESWKIHRGLIDRVEWGDAVWTCTAEDVPLVTAVSDSARVLTPSRAAP